jgi:transcriptional regulator with XRE-family HTH domain
LPKPHEEAGLSQRDMADKLDITQRALSWWERQPVALRPVAGRAGAVGSAVFVLN